MTSETVLDRVRSLVTADPFAMREAPASLSFDQVPDLLSDEDVVRLTSVTVRAASGMSYSEEVFDDLTCYVRRRTSGDVRALQTGLLTTAQSLTSAVVRDGVAGDYSVTDEGRRVDVDTPDGAAYAVLRVVWPLSYMRTL